jgi:hypothetical protein
VLLMFVFREREKREIFQDLVFKSQIFITRMLKKIHTVVLVKKQKTLFWLLLGHMRYPEAFVGTPIPQSFKKLSSIYQNNS